jgi:hypothetical protein
MDAPAVAVRAFREQLRASMGASTRGRGWAHFSFTTVASLAVITAAITATRDVRPLEWLVLPATFLLANTVEYLAHRGPMHRRRRRLAFLYERHTLRHHRFFTRDAMGCDSAADFGLVLFPPALLLFFLGGVALPVAALLFVLASRNAGCLFVACAMGYFLSYEWLHFVYHLPDDNPIGRFPVVRSLRQHHAMHHDLRAMAHCNFNITFPVCDWLFGTRRQG